jgi:hypothetical protein
MQTIILTILIQARQPKQHIIVVVIERLVGFWINLLESLPIFPLVSVVGIPKSPTGIDWRPGSLCGYHCRCYCHCFENSPLMPQVLPTVPCHRFCCGHVVCMQLLPCIQRSHRLRPRQVQPPRMPLFPVKQTNKQQQN